MLRLRFLSGRWRSGWPLLLGVLFALSCTHNRPDPPEVPVGPSSVELDSAYIFKASASDGGQYKQYGPVWIRFDWGDGDTSSWCGHGETVQCSHSWREGGTYAVRAQAHDDRTESSEWSEPLTVTAAVPTYPYRLVDSVSIIGAPLNDAHVTPNGEYAYVTNDWSGALSVVRTSDLHLVAQIPFNHGWGSPGQVVCSPGGECVYATWYRAGGGIAIVRTADQVVTDSLMLADRLRGLAISPDGKRLFVAVDSDSGFIAVVRLTDNVIEDTIFTPGWGYATSLQVAPDGTRLYAGSQEGIFAIDLADNTIVWQVGSYVSPASGGTVLYTSGGFVYVVGEDEFVSVLESGTGSLLDSVSLSPYSWSWNGSVAPDGSFLYVTCGNGDDTGAVAVVRTSDNKVVRVMGMPDVVLDVAPSPDGQRLYVAAENGKLYVLGR